MKHINFLNFNDCRNINYNKFDAIITAINKTNIKNLQMDLSYLESAQKLNKHILWNFKRHELCDRPKEPTPLNMKVLNTTNFLESLSLRAERNTI